MDESTEHEECELCLAPTEIARLQDVDGITQCPSCAALYHRRLLELRRLTLEERVDLNTGSDSRFQWYVFDVTIPNALEIDARLKKETTSQKIAKFFGRKELEIGVADFDKKILIQPEEGSEHLTEALLENETTRKIILSLLATGYGDKQFDEVLLVNSLVSGRVAFASNSREHDVPRLRMLALGLAANIDRCFASLTHR